MATYKVIDIYNGDKVTDWDQVQKEVKFIILKCSQGHSLSSSKYMFKDVKLDEYAKECIQRKIPFAVYHFFTAQDEQEQIQEQKFQVDCVKDYIDYVNYIFCDVENYNNKYLLNQSRSQLTYNTKLFCDYVEEQGFDQGVYLNPDHIKHFINQEELPYPIWLQAYVDKMPTFDNLNIIGWQYGEKPINGISGDVDVNEFYVAMKSPRKPYLKPVSQNIKFYELKKRVPKNNQAFIVQQILKQNGYKDSKGRDPEVDGYFTEYTGEAIKEFQMDIQIPVTGIVDSLTWEKLLSL